MKEQSKHLRRRQRETGEREKTINPELVLELDARILYDDDDDSRVSLQNDFLRSMIRNPFYAFHFDAFTHLILMCPCWLRAFFSVNKCI